jgi:hypothetical protein
MGDLDADEWQQFLASQQDDGDYDENVLRAMTDRFVP